MVGNFSLLAAILVVGSLRQASNAFLFHQCLLDFLKAACCLPFARSLVTSESAAHCPILASTYIVLITSSSFNMLAMVMNEAYQFSDLTLNMKESRNCYCVLFGVSTTWFGSIIMNLGIAFIPSNRGYNERIDECVFIYGVTHTYVLHILWVLIITMALIMTLTYLWKLRKDINRMSYYRLSTLVRATVYIDPELNTETRQHEHEVQEKEHIQWVQTITTKKLYLLILLSLIFILFWYPYFVLTIVDPFYHVDRLIYITLTIFAWSNPTVTPIILMFYLKTTCCCVEPGVPHFSAMPHLPRQLSERDVDRYVMRNAGGQQQGSSHSPICPGVDTSWPSPWQEPGSGTGGGDTTGNQIISSDNSQSSLPEWTTWTISLTVLNRLPTDLLYSHLAYYKPYSCN